MSSTPGPTDPLIQAALFAGRAPSLHNTQPWHWHAHSGVLDLSLAPRRLLRVSDPTARLATISCGAALHHARVHLAAHGRRAPVSRVPAPDDPYLLARIGPVESDHDDHDAHRLLRAACHRHTDRRHQPTDPLDMHLVRSVRQAVAGAGAELTVLRPQQIFAVARAAEQAQDVEADDPGWQVEVADWVGGDRPTRTGIPASALPDDPYLLTAPTRVLRRAGSALITESRGNLTAYAVLHTAADGRRDWLRAGEALSAGWLTATGLDVAVLPLSVVTEVAGARDRIRHLLDWSGYPHLVLRLAAGRTDAGRPGTPRLPIEAVLTVG